MEVKFTDLFKLAPDKSKIFSKIDKLIRNNQFIGGEEVLNICRSHPIKTENLVNKILKLYKKNKIQIKKIGYVNGEMLKTHGSNQKLKKTLKIKSFKSIDEGLRKTIINFKKNNF